MRTTSKVIIGGAAIALLLAATAASADREVDGEKAYRENCASCHDHRIEGAPKTGAPADWEGRSWNWEAVQLEHAKAGYLAMPARGGNAALSDYDTGAAVEYMLNLTFPDLPRD